MSPRSSPAPTASPCHELDAAVAELAERARAGALTPDDIAGATFTLSNGGHPPVDITTAILNPPQVAILWIGRVRDRPVACDGAWPFGRRSRPA